MACYSYGELEYIAKQGGFPDSMLSTMAAIAMAESGGCDIIQQGQPYNTTGWGLWQITPGNSASNIATDHGLLDPIANAKAAYYKYSHSSGGLNIWSTYWEEHNNYKYFLQNNVPPVPIRATPGSGILPGTGDRGGGSPSLPNIPIDPSNPANPLPWVQAGMGPLTGFISGAAGGVAKDVIKTLLPYILLLSAFAIILLLLAKELSQKGGVSVPTGGGSPSMPVPVE